MLTTHELPFADTLRLKYVEEMVETYYNSGRFLHTLAYLVPLYESPFAFFEALSQFWVAENYHYLGLSKMGLFDALMAVCGTKSESGKTEIAVGNEV